MSSLAGAQGWDRDYESRAQEVAAGLIRINGLMDWTANNPAGWPEIGSSGLPGYKAARPVQGVEWAREGGPARLKTLILANLKLQRVADFSRLTSLNRLEVYGNQLRGLNLDGNQALIELAAMNNHLASLNLGACPELRRLSVSNNQLKELDFSANPRLTGLFISGNQLTDLRLGGLSELAELEVMNNRLTTIDLSANPLLSRLLVSYNRLSELDLSSNQLLTELGVRDNSLDSIDISFNAALADLQAGRNLLASLNLNGNPALVRLSAEHNRIEVLDLSHNPALETIELQNNPLSGLNLGENNLNNLKTLNLDGCRLPLSTLYGLSGKAVRGRLGRQENVLFEHLSLTQGQGLDLSAEALIDGTPTTFMALTEKKRRVRPDQYQEDQGLLTFKAPGKYLVEMSNEKVFSSETNELTGRVRKFKVKVITGLIEVGPSAGEF